VEIVLPRAQVSLHVDPDEALRGEPPKASLDPQGSLTQRLERQLRSGAGTKGGSVSRRIAALARAGSVFGTAIAGHRRLGREDRTVLGTVSVAVIISAVLFAVFPTVVGWALAVVLAWFGAVMATRALIQARRARREEAENP
jgi:hypothetical protein